MEDLRQSLAILKDELALSEDASEELLVLLECVVRTPEKSVLFPCNGDFSVALKVHDSRQQAWIVGKKVYDHTFVFVVLQSASGNRAIADTIWANGQSD